MKKINIVRTILILLSIIFIIYGITNGDIQRILKKSIFVCMECIGLG